MKTHATVMALNCKWAIVMLHGEVVSDCTRPVADEVEGLRETASRKQVVKQVVESFLGEFVNVTKPDIVFI